MAEHQKKINGTASLYGQCLVCPDKVDLPYGIVRGQDDRNPHYLCCGICSRFWDSLGFSGQQDWLALSREERTRRFQAAPDEAKTRRIGTMQQAPTTPAG